MAERLNNTEDFLRQNAMQMIRHDYKGIYLDAGKTTGKRLPKSIGNVTQAITGVPLQNPIAWFKTLS